MKGESYKRTDNRNISMVDVIQNSYDIKRIDPDSTPTETEGCLKLLEVYHEKFFTRKMIMDNKMVKVLIDVISILEMQHETQKEGSGFTL